MSLLPGLIQLSPSVYLSEPDDEQSRSYSVGQDHSGGPLSVSPASGPSKTKLIILFTWMSAHPNHISKYVLGYRDQYPDSRIIVIRSSSLDVFYHRTSTVQSCLAPAISSLLSFCSGTSDPAIVLHAFSNGGCYQFCNFVRAYRKNTSQPFPSHTKIFDSCPGRATFRRTVLAVSVGLPQFPPIRLLLLILVYAIIGLNWLIYVPFGIADPIERIRQSLNDRAMMQGEAKRCYIYSETDPMVGWHDVETHAEDSVKKGCVVQREKFDGSGHCAHMRVGGGVRYWAIVESMFRQEQWPNF